MTSHQSEKPLYHCPECGLEKRRDYCLKCGTFGNTATNEIVESEKPTMTKTEVRKAYARFSQMTKAHSLLGFGHDGWMFCPCKDAQAIRVAYGALPAPEVFLLSEKPPSCKVCRTKDAGMPVPGYIHDPGCTREKPPSGVEVLQEWKGWHQQHQHDESCTSSNYKPYYQGGCQEGGKCEFCSCKWPCPMFRAMEQIEELHSALTDVRQFFTARDVVLMPKIDKALTLSKLEAR